MKVTACIIARTASSRLPNKVLLPLGKRSMIEILFERVKLVKGIDNTYLCTSVSSENDVLSSLAKKNKVGVCRGAENDVVDRMLNAAQLSEADAVIRITADNPLTDPYYLSHCINVFRKGNFDYVRAINLPVGITAEVIRTTTLEDVYKTFSYPEEGQYLMIYMFNPDVHRCAVTPALKKHSRPDLNFSIDTKEKYLVFKRMVEEFEGKKRQLKLEDVISYADKCPRLFVLQKGEHFKRPGGKTVSWEQAKREMDERIRKSQKIEI